MLKGTYGELNEVTWLNELKRWSKKRSSIYSFIEKEFSVGQWRMNSP